VVRQPPLNEEGALDRDLAKELTRDLFLHFQYVRLILFEGVDRNPFGARRPRTAGLAASIIPQITFQQYVKGLALLVKDGEAVDRGRLLFDVYARQYEGYITWEEVTDILKAHTTDLSPVGCSPL
jgi:hypothetical protein